MLAPVLSQIAEENKEKVKVCKVNNIPITPSVFLRTAEEIETAFDELQRELEDVINERLKKTHRSLLENFDEEVVQKLKMRQIDDVRRVNTYNRALWLLATAVLQNRISDVDDDSMSFTLVSSPSDTIPKGKYILPFQVSIPRTKAVPPKSIGSKLLV